MRSLDFTSLLLFSAIFCVILIIYGEWQDAHMEVNYTDVDYLVFSDAVSLMASGDSPYKRTTYRYSPLLAFLLIPNSLIHRSWGKFIFSASDLLVGYFIHFILQQRKVPRKLCNYCVMTWLFNPFTFTIGTRGNCEPVVCAMILWIIICLMKVVEKLISFLLQFMVQLVLILCFAKDLPFCLFAQTVAFNKVITAQYFVWFFCLLPLILPWSKMKLKWDGMLCILSWMGAQVHWLMWGYLLEFKGINVFLELWVASLVFHAANVFILTLVIRHHRFSSFFQVQNCC
ncbi:hypothetical protein Ahy_A02g008152 isoform A [Arachis hypogaea]|uniref:GPI mannosyltransferase 1 n=1 Tax=Arachis hypogaea TaxID=3818 RepID=A0A445EEK6_ARAHY|nr:hypothetical protein Ahy_A02g008152 isoform A [Arachis hypogaea]